MRSDIQMQELVDQLSALDKEIEKARPTRSLWTALLSWALVVVAVGASIAETSEWWLAANLAVVAGLMSVPLMRVRRLERQRDRLLDGMDRPPGVGDGADGPALTDSSGGRTQLPGAEPDAP